MVVNNQNKKTEKVPANEPTKGPLLEFIYENNYVDQLPIIQNKSQSLTPSKKNSPIKKRLITQKTSNATTVNSRHITPNRPGVCRNSPMIEIPNYNVLTDPGNVTDYDINTSHNSTSKNKQGAIKKNLELINQNQIQTSVKIQQKTQQKFNVIDLSLIHI
eukprot:TRINITY_DN12267_c0_g1_i2.p1 TRINITY_DN12267_c0_g1~~TRINITY_DN12267_c0_g1_i2.p1  ORF type:complete len:160 (+),score=27.31 TRINITY_DN12267_c0_g1_i2:207-686(+)